MRRSVLNALVLLVAFGWFPRAAAASPIGIGFLTFDDNGSGGLLFDITNLTGLNSFSPDFPIGTAVTITVTNLVANKSGGGTIPVAGGNFTGSGDLQCSVAGDAASGGCNFAAYDLVSAVLTGTFSPTSGLADRESTRLDSSH